MDYRSLFSFDGRMGRAQYWLTYAALMVLVGLAAAAASAGIIGRAVVVEGGEAGGALEAEFVTFVFIMAPAFALATWIGAASAVRRYHDRGKSGIWWFACFIPVIGPLWQFIELGFLPGDEGPNRFGPPPVGGFGAGGVRSGAGDGPLEEALSAVRAMHDRLGPDPREVDATARALEKNRRRFEKRAGGARRSGR